MSVTTFIRVLRGSVYDMMGELKMLLNDEVDPVAVKSSQLETYTQPTEE